MMIMIHATSIHLTPLTMDPSNSEIDDNDVHAISIHLPAVTMDQFQSDFSDDSHIDAESSILKEIMMLEDAWCCLEALFKWKSAKALCF
ncbi:hypothetical protein L2E82_31137 [Cichorium intybus]|uniref:Uncharacterized protein n=1 Tax=Cichorium intybus TaxID=13427 RepID=A0ACB9D301_CICIN|nr:hypothetical protein L2E82_31137 [Cichorium intybus]